MTAAIRATTSVTATSRDRRLDCKRFMPAYPTDGVTWQAAGLGNGLLPLSIAAQWVQDFSILERFSLTPNKLVLMLGVR
jgi:hypothetical protein